MKPEKVFPLILMLLYFGAAVAMAMGAYEFTATQTLVVTGLAALGGVYATDLASKD